MPVGQGNRPLRRPPGTAAAAPGIPGPCPSEPLAPPKADEPRRGAASAALAAGVPPSRNGTGAADNAQDPVKSRPLDYPSQRPTAPSPAADSRCCT